MPLSKVIGIDSQSLAPFNACAVNFVPNMRAKRAQTDEEWLFVIIPFYKHFRSRLGDGLGQADPSGQHQAGIGRT